jgi:23S rRNA (adenine2503-C2)-methyltransferase
LKSLDISSCSISGSAVATKTGLTELNVNLNIKNPDIKNLDKNQLIEWCRINSLPPYRAVQIMRWVYGRGASTFDEMTDISKKIRALISCQFSLHPLDRETIETSRDGSKKYLFRLDDGNAVESVLIPEKNHYTLCISTQVGCAMGCRFCMTARSGLIRNLTQGEITGQILGVRKDVPDEKRLSNLVLMGMGEPLANYDQVIGAIGIITDNDDGLQFSTRRVTLSTAGLIPKLENLGQATKIRLAISLNAADDETRNFLMPINQKYPLKDLIAACAHYPLAPRDKITFEYILIKDVNDSLKDAERLAKLLRPVKAKINLIPFNEHPGSDFTRPEEQAILAFQDVLANKNYTAIIRYSKGTDISAACGQLSAKKIASGSGP